MRNGRKKEIHTLTLKSIRVAYRQTLFQLVPDGCVQLNKGSQDRGREPGQILKASLVVRGFEEIPSGRDRTPQPFPGTNEQMRKRRIAIDVGERKNAMLIINGTG